MRIRRTIAGLTAVVVLVSAACCACASPVAAARPVKAAAHGCCTKSKEPAPAPVAPKQHDHHCHHCGTTGSFEMPRGGGTSAPTPFDVLLTVQTPIDGTLVPVVRATRATVIPAERDTPPPTLLDLRCALLR